MMQNNAPNQKIAFRNAAASKVVEALFASSTKQHIQHIPKSGVVCGPRLQWSPPLLVCCIYRALL